MSESKSHYYFKKVRAETEERLAIVAEKYELRKRFDTSKAQVTAVVEPYQTRAMQKYDKVKGVAVVQFDRSKACVHAVAEPYQTKLCGHYERVKNTAVERYGQSRTVLVTAVEPYQSVAVRHYERIKGAAEDRVARGKQKVCEARAQAERIVTVMYGYLVAVLVWVAVLMQDRVPLLVAERVECIVGLISARGMPKVVEWADKKFLRGHIFRTVVPAVRRVIADVDTALQTCGDDKKSTSSVATSGQTTTTTDAPISVSPSHTPCELSTTALPERSPNPKPQPTPAKVIEDVEKTTLIPPSVSPVAHQSSSPSSGEPGLSEKDQQQEQHCGLLPPYGDGTSHNTNSGSRNGNNRNNKGSYRAKKNFTKKNITQN